MENIWKTVLMNLKQAVKNTHVLWWNNYITDVYIAFIYSFCLHLRFNLTVFFFKQTASNKHHPCQNYVYSKTYKQQSNLHSGRKAYTCDVCNKSFTWPSHLRVNQCTQSGGHPFTLMCVIDKSRSRLTWRTLNTCSGGCPFTCEM